MGGRKLGEVKRAEKQKPSEPRGRGQANAITRGQAKTPSSKTPSSKAPSQSAPATAERAKPPTSGSEPVVRAQPGPMAAPQALPPDKLKPPK